MDLTIPGERTITLLAYIFKLTPVELVKDNTYPQAKAERLPNYACSFTPQEMELALMENDLVWLVRTKGCQNWEWIKSEVLQHWRACLQSRQAKIFSDSTGRTFTWRWKKSRNLKMILLERQENLAKKRKGVRILVPDRRINNK